MPFMYCDLPARVTQILPATDEGHAGHGVVTLSNGAWFEITKSSYPTPEGDFVVKLHKGDRIEMCYGPAQTWADEPANVRMAIIGNIENNAFYGPAGPAKK